MSACKLFFLFICVLLTCSQTSKSQVTRTVKGSLSDTTKQTIPGANIRVISGKDTLSSSSDQDGEFIFKGLKEDNFELLIRSIGYKPFSGKYTFNKVQEVFDLAGITLHTDQQLLDEVVIRAKIVPVKVKKDTIEYNTGAYTVRDGDYVEDLLKQLPGIEVNSDGEVKAMGKGMTKIRVNGKDFFTGDVKKFIKELPAEMFSHIQVIDDYGDEANFTGIKKGEPVKILNLVTKPGRNRGTFGNVGVNAGTNDRYGVLSSANLWRDSRQTGINANYNKTNSSSGTNNGIMAGANLRDQFTTKIMGGIDYSYMNNKSKSTELTYVESVNQLGTLYSDNESFSNTNANSHNINMDMDGKFDKDYVTAALNGSFSDGNSSSKSSSVQSGIIRQDLKNDNLSDQHSPNLNGNIGWGRKLGKKGRTLFVNLAGGFGNSSSKQDMINRIGYYDKIVDTLIKDSLLNRIADNKNLSNTLNAGITFSEPLNKPNDSLVTKSIDFNYSFGMNSTNNSVQTQVRDLEGNVGFVDSLSNKYTSRFISNNFRLSYRYGSKKLNYSAGLSLQPVTLTGSYEGRTDRINQTTVNFSPAANMSYVISSAQAIDANYSGNSNAPDFQQLQPVPDTRNLQNVIIGNPELKTSFNHSANISYRYFDPTNGSTIQVSFNGTMVQNQVVSNVVFLKDTLDGLKQETRYLNANGNYSTGGMYALSIPFKENKYTISTNGMLNYSNNVLFSDNVENHSKRFNFTQQLKMSINTKVLNFGTNLSYDLNSSTYSLPSSTSAKIESWLFDVTSRIHATNSFLINVNASKRFNRGYAIASNNPFLISANLEKSFFKNKSAVLTFQANDILNQGNGLNRMLLGNSIIDSRTTQVTRFFLLGFSMRIRNFRGRAAG